MSVLQPAHPLRRTHSSLLGRVLWLAVLVTVPVGIAAARAPANPYGVVPPDRSAARSSSLVVGRPLLHDLALTRPARADELERLRAQGYPSAVTQAAPGARTGADTPSRAPYAPLALPCGVFTNCSFETGTLAGWTSLDLATPFFPAQVAPPGTSAGVGAPSTPTDGGFSYVNGFDGAGPGVISLAQDVILSPDAVALSFDIRAAWYNYGTLARTFSVDIEPSGGGAPLASTLVLSAAAGTTNPDTGPLTVSMPVAGFAGQSVRVVFRWSVPENFTGPAFFELDRIQVPESICGTVANCSFETGSASSWALTEFPVPYFPSFVTAAGTSVGFGLFTSAPTDGSLALVHSFDAFTPGDMFLTQDVTLPAGALSVEFDYRAGWDMKNFGGSTLPRSFHFEVQPSGGGAALAAKLILIAPAGTILLDSGPRTSFFDVSAFAGMPVRLVFRWNVPEPTTGPAFFQLDRVRVSNSVCGDISNCSFESGALPGWSATDFPSPLYPLHVGGIESIGYGLFTTAPSNLTRAFILGFDAGGLSTAELHQDVKLPVWASRLRFDYRAGWDMVTYGGSTQPRLFEFGLEPSGGGPLLMGETVLTAPPATKVLDTGPVTRSVDVSAFAGQDVRLVFRWHVPQPFTGPGLFQLDHVALNSSLLDAPSGQAAHTLTLLPAAPNPARATTTFRVSLPVAGPVELEIVDVRGGRIWYERRSGVPAGEHALTWDGRTSEGRAAPAGVYFAHVRTRDAGSSRMFVRVH